MTNTATQSTPLKITDRELTISSVSGGVRFWAGQGGSVWVATLDREGEQKDCYCLLKTRDVNEFKEWVACHFGNNDLVERYLDPEDDPYPPETDDTVLCCPNCERPNQFGEMCHSCSTEVDG